MTREEIEKQMDTLARKYVETHDPEIVEALYQLARLARELEKLKEKKRIKSRGTIVEFSFF